MPIAIKVLAQLSGKKGGATLPGDVLVADSAGDLYGTTKGGGAYGLGTLFEISGNGRTFGSETTLVDLNATTGTRPDAGLIADAAGNLFGTTHLGGANNGGTAFELQLVSPGSYSQQPLILADFSYFGGPVGGLIKDTDGNLFGTAAYVGVGPVTIFELVRNGTSYAPPIRLASIAVTNAILPTGGLFIDGQNNLIGTMTGGGASPNGSVFELKKTLAGGYDTVPVPLVNFAGADGANPKASLIADGAGNLFGTTQNGGAVAPGYGTVFEIPRDSSTPTGYASKPTVLVSFDSADGAFPLSGLIADMNGNLYGTTSGGGKNGFGTVFEVAKSPKFTTGYNSVPVKLFDFTGGIDGATPIAGLFGNNLGNLFGTTSAGGTAGQGGTVFELTGTGFSLSNVVSAPTATSITISPSRGDLLTGTFVTFTVAMSAAVLMSSNAPSLTLNDNGNAAYDAAHSTPTSLVFDYTVQNGESTTALVATGLALHGATITDPSKIASAVFTPALPATFKDVEINIPAPAVTSVVASPGSGNQKSGTQVTLTVTMSESIVIAGGVPSLLLNDGGSAIYDATHSTGTILAFDYMPKDTDSTTALAVTGFSANGATMQDSLGNTADFTAASVTFTGLAINSLLPAVASIVANPGNGNMTTGAVVTLTATMSEAVIVSDGTPTLTLNDGGTATFDVAKSSGTTLVFDYSVMASQTTTALASTEFHANGAKIADALGNEAVLTGAIATFTGLSVNLPAATVLSITPSPATGDVMTGGQVTLITTMSKAVAVTAGSPFLTLNDGGTATYDRTTSTATALVFDYVPQSGQNTLALAVTGLNPNGATIQDPTGVPADFSGVARTFAGLEVNITTPTAPTITGAAAGQATTDTIAVSPFFNVTITDLNPNQTESVTVTLSTPSNGTLSNLGGGTYNSASGVYSTIGSPSVVTVALEGLVFTPASQLVQSGATVTTAFAINVLDTAGLSATNALTTVVTTKSTQPVTGVVGALDVRQQLELIYIAYFNRAADSGGYTFWSGQNDLAQTHGQSASLALTNIANSFQPQAETIALYPFLGSIKLNLADPVIQAGLSLFIGSVYHNLFGHTPDALGRGYWAGQLTTGAVGLGAAALAIANGAIGTDAIALRNKISVAQDFTTRTAAAGLGVTNAPASLVAAARTVLTGVDGMALDDPSVIAGISQTTLYLSGSLTSGTSVGVGNAASPRTATLSHSAKVAVVPTDPNIVTITGGDQLVDPSSGSVTIGFLSPPAEDLLVAPANGADLLAGFGTSMDVLDVRTLLRVASSDPRGDDTMLSGFLPATGQSADPPVGLSPGVLGGAGVVPVSQGNADSLIALDSIRIP